MSLLSFIPIIGTIIDKIIPDKNAAEKAKQELEKMELTGELQLLAKQIEVNVGEARSNSVFVAGWRPFIGWVCGIAFAYHFVVLPFLLFLVAAFGADIPLEHLPKFDLSTMMPVLLGMLGLGGFRTFEKVKGVDRGNA